MATLSLLDMVQDILSAMESDNVNDISDTEESEAVARVIKETYFDLVSQRDWPWLTIRTNLEGLADEDNPTKMQFPDDVNKVFWIKYNKKDVTWMTPKDFQDMIDLREELADVVDENGYVLNNDPTYWTSFDDTYVYFDSIDTDEDDTLQGSKAVIYALTVPEWTHESNFVPTLPDKMFPLLLADAKGTCFLNSKQTANPKEERKAQRLKVKMQRESIRNDQGESKSNTSVDYGRR